MQFSLSHAHNEILKRENCHEPRNGAEFVHFALTLHDLLHAKKEEGMCVCKRKEVIHERDKIYEREHVCACVYVY